MIIPYHVQVYCIGGSIFRGFFYKRGQEFAMKLEDDAKIHDGGVWSDIFQADTFARTLMNELVASRLSSDALRKHKGARLIVAFDNVEGKYSVVAGYPPYKWEDTGARFDTQEEARRAIDSCIRT